ncbi:MAG: FecR family protein [Spirochaetales bacterium]|jgi:hypothetical protein|nr:FecR family protein [Spirochaetales bacterium]
MKTQKNRKTVFIRGYLGRLLFVGSIFFLGVFPALAQSEVVAILEYCDYPDQVYITDSEGFLVRQAYFGLDLGKGDSIRTENTAAELRLTHNNSIIRIAPRTNLRIDSLAGSRGDTDNSFSLLSGKMLCVVPASAGGKFLVKTPAGLCEADGAHFAVSAEQDTVDAAAVREGTVSFTKTGSAQTIVIGAGLAADALVKDFQPEVWPEEKIERIFYDLDFVMLDPSDILKTELPVLETTPSPVAFSLAPETAAAPTEPARENANSPQDIFSLDAEMGMVTIEKQTYAKIALNPLLTLGDFRMALHLPLIFSGDFMTQNDRYKPAGNDEWDFGRNVDQDRHRDIGRKDFLRDLALKLYFIEYGQPGDTFFINAGNIRELSIGHGALMYKYANDTDFPALRRVGVHIGMDTSIGGFELMSADLAEADIAAGRLYAKPIPAVPFSIGVSAAVDKHPVFSVSDSVKSAFPLASGEDPSAIDPMLLGFALDTDLQLIKGDSVSLTIFADTATMIPYLRHEYTGASSPFRTRGTLFDAYYDTSFSSKFRNYGLTGGFFGNLDVFDYRLEYRQYRGFFRPGFFGPNYDHLRARLAWEALDYIADPDSSDYNRKTIAVYGEAGITLWDKLRLSAGYLFPGEMNGGNIDSSDRDYFELRFSLEKGLVPVPVLDRLSLSLSYTREMFAPLVRDLTRGRHAEFVSPYTVFKSEASYAVTDNVDIALSLATAADRDAEGYIVYDADFNPEWSYTLAIQTRIRF